MQHRDDLFARVMRLKYSAEHLHRSPAALILPAHIRQLVDELLQLLADLAQYLANGGNDNGQ